MDFRVNEFDIEPAEFPQFRNVVSDDLAKNRPTGFHYGFRADAKPDEGSVLLAFAQVSLPRFAGEDRFPKPLQNRVFVNSRTEHRNLRSDEFGVGISEQFGNFRVHEKNRAVQIDFRIRLVFSQKLQTGNEFRAFRSEGIDFLAQAEVFGNQALDVDVRKKAGNEFADLCDDLRGMGLRGFRNKAIGKRKNPFAAERVSDGVGTSSVRWDGIQAAPLPFRGPSCLVVIFAYGYRFVIYMEI